MNKIKSADHRRFETYPEYRDSGVEWLSEIPAHWTIRRLKTIASVELSNVDKKTLEGQQQVRLCNYVDVYYNERITTDLEFMSASATADQVRRFGLKAGDVLITKDSETPDDIAVPAVVAQDLQDVICGYHLAHVRPDASLMEGRFLARAFSAVGLRDQFHVAANGITRFGLTGDSIKASEFPVPPIDEQRSIAAFLERETAKIDALIAKKERLIELLQGKRAALITRAVTKGLNPHAPMKDSGMSSIGIVPSHWQLKRLKHLTPDNRPIMYGIVLPGPDVDDGVPIVKGGDVKLERLRLELLNRTTFEIEAGYKRSRLKEGDIVYAIRGGIGDAELIPKEIEGANLTQDAARISPVQHISRIWLLYCLKSRAIFQQLEAGALGATIRGINIRDLKRAVIPLPPQAEQVKIAEYLQEQTKRLDALTDKVRGGIDRLNEYRTALISAAVTGKIDVRNEVPADEAR